MNCAHPFGYEQHKLDLVGYTNKADMELGGDERVEVGMEWGLWEGLGEKWGASNIMKMHCIHVWNSQRIIKKCKIVFKCLEEKSCMDKNGW